MLAIVRKGGLQPFLSRLLFRKPLQKRCMLEIEDDKSGGGGGGGLVPRLSPEYRARAREKLFLNLGLSVHSFLNNNM